MRIAIVRLSSLGDVIVSSSMLAALKALMDCRIEWFVDERFAGILENSPCLSKIHSLPFKKMLSGLTGIFEFRSYARHCGQYDMVVDMQGLLKSASVGKCLSAKKFVGFSSNGCREGMASYLYSHKVDIPYEANILERNFEVLFSHIDKFKEAPFDISRALQMHSQSLGIKYHDISSDLVSLFHQKGGIGRPVKLLFILEASIPQKVYPLQNYVQLANKLARFVPECKFFLIWHDDEKNADTLLSFIRQEGFQAVKLPKLDFNSIKFVMKQMDCVIGGDTGLTHLAWALGTPSITLYGNGEKSKGKNMSETSIDRVLLGNPFVMSPSGKFEISSISPDSVFTVFKHEIYEKIILENQH